MHNAARGIRKAPPGYASVHRPYNWTARPSPVPSLAGWGAKICLCGSGTFIVPNHAANLPVSISLRNHWEMRFHAGLQTSCCLKRCRLSDLSAQKLQIYFPLRLWRGWSHAASRRIKMAAFKACAPSFHIPGPRTITRQACCTRTIPRRSNWCAGTTV